MQNVFVSILAYSSNIFSLCYYVLYYFPQRRENFKIRTVLADDQNKCSAS